MTFSQ